MMYEVYVLWIRPVLQKYDETPLLKTFVKLICPVGFITYNSFVSIFEGILNCYAEFSRFGDRLFYLDFWNATNLDEWSREWNRPVHLFLKEYVYVYAAETYNLSQIKAYLVTVVFSAIFHELVFVFCHAIVVHVHQCVRTVPFNGHAHSNPTHIHGLLFEG
eukprot:TRINITY_DN4378_c0_g5_i1.p2 TRINITY_DN4378_c0_g5~~TRINITY_DN4378_c0_g5_i1.p2  ORF type:complete len:161 (-),score=10.86 TRINITY_DN4378_c0_g5_i1:200-682(-)